MRAYGSHTDADTRVHISDENVHTGELHRVRARRDERERYRGWGLREVAVGSQKGCGRRAIVGVAPRLPWRLSARRPINSIPMATTDNIGHTPCRTTTLPFGHSVLPFTDAWTKGRRPKKSRGLRARNLSEGFPRNPAPAPSSNYPKPASVFARLLSPHCNFRPLVLFSSSYFLYFRFFFRFPSRSACSSLLHYPLLSSFLRRWLSHPSVSPSASLSCHSSRATPL